MTNQNDDPTYDEIEEEVDIDQDADDEAVLLEEDEEHSTVAPGQGSNDDASPAVQDGQSASGHAPDPEVDDNVDDLGDEAGIKYAANEELGIDQKYQLETEVEPPKEDTPS